MAAILVIEDDDSLRELVTRFLEKEGHEIVVASDGNEGVEVFKKRSFDLVITDLILPEKEGLETIIEIRKLKPGLKVVAMSGGGKNNPANYLAMAKRLGATGVIAKPFTKEELLALVNDVLQKN